MVTRKDLRKGRNTGFNGVGTLPRRDSPNGQRSTPRWLPNSKTLDRTPPQSDTRHHIVNLKLGPLRHLIRRPNTTKREEHGPPMRTLVSFVYRLTLEEYLYEY